jgi:hypothetical protein
MSTTNQEDLATGQHVRKILSTQASSFRNATITGARSINMARMHYNVSLHEQTFNHSVLQLQHFGVEVDKTPRALGSKQRIRTSSGHVIPLSIQNGLAHIDMCPPTDLDYNTYPHVFLTSDSVWDPSSFDDKYTPDGMETEELVLFLTMARIEFLILGSSLNVP